MSITKMQSGGLPLTLQYLHLLEYSKLTSVSFTGFADTLHTHIYCSKHTVIYYYYCYSYISFSPDSRNSCILLTACRKSFNSAFRVSYLIRDLVSSNLKTCHFKVFLLYNKQIINRFLVSYNKTSKDYNFKHLKGHTGPFFNFTLWLWNLYSLKVPSEDLTSICALEVCISTPLPQTEGKMG